MSFSIISKEGILVLQLADIMNTKTLKANHKRTHGLKKYLIKPRNRISTHRSIFFNQRAEDTV